MKAHGELLIDHFAEHDKDKAGYSAVQLITTSAISAHFVDQTGAIYLNLFSCKDYNVDTVLDLLYQYFMVSESNHLVIERKI